MALTVETGAGVPGADSYLGLADADQRLDARGAAAWAEAPAAAREAALRRATDRLDALHGGRWIGVAAVPDAVNGRAWPRRDAVEASGRGHAADAVPEAVRAATALLALVLLGTDPAADPSGLRRVALGPFAVEFDTGATGLPAEVAALVAPLLRDGAGAVPRPFAGGGAAAPAFRVGLHDHGDRR